MLSTMAEKPIEIEEPQREREINAHAPCRVTSAESNMLGECMKCGTKVGEPCPMPRTE